MKTEQCERGLNCIPKIMNDGPLQARQKVIHVRGLKPNVSEESKNRCRGVLPRKKFLRPRLSIVGKRPILTAIERRTESTTDMGSFSIILTKISTS